MPSFCIILVSSSDERGEGIIYLKNHHCRSHINIVFWIFSGHGTKLEDDDPDEEEDGYDEALVPLDFRENGMIRDDDLLDIVIKPLPDGVHVVALVRKMCAVYCKMCRCFTTTSPPLTRIPFFLSTTDGLLPQWNHP
jgi:hypothetical protein